MKIGLALGGGGVRGLAHIPAFEVLDEEEIRPVGIAGTSVGAIMGVLYASGWLGSEVRRGVEEHIVLRGERFEEVRRKRRNLLKWLRFFRPTRKAGAMLSADGFLRYLLEQLEVETFEDLAVPLHVVATDFHAAERVVFDHGPLLPALKASMAIPGVFEPVLHEGRVLVDGGMVDNVPWDVLSGRCDAVIAIDVPPARDPGNSTVPGAVDTFLGSFEMLIEKTTIYQLEKDPPALFFRPDLKGIRTLDFNKIESVFDQAEQSMDRFREEVRALLRRSG